jgi:hypothetical protein
MRREPLRLLEDTCLIYDQQAKEGLKQYFEGTTPQTPPQDTPFNQSGETIPLTPSTAENTPKTDINLFAFGAAKANSQAKAISSMTCISL